MTENSIQTISIRELLGERFFIPDYQRGYRWTDQQVLDLLTDIWEFSKADHNEYEFYCLQPLVVKKVCQPGGLEGDWYEVIDGQQRLTTLYLILSYLQSELNGLQLYELTYQRNLSFTSKDFVQNMKQATRKTIDEHYMCNAYDCISRWFEENIADVDKEKFAKALIESEYDGSENPRDKANNVRFIWYESVDEDPIKVFTRLNVGKISLTNSELIKALFLNRSNFQKEDNDYNKLRQQEIASEWDSIEYTLQNDEFWLFLHEKNYNRPTRIDLIFDIICKENVLGKFPNVGNDEYKTFRYFYEYFKSDACDMRKCWKQVKRYFQVFKEWYNDLELFHYVGFLIEHKLSLDALLREWVGSKDKQTFVTSLKNKIKDVLSKCPALEYQYDVEGTDKGKCRPILVFHNIQTVINQNRQKENNDKYQVGVFYRFPFHLYKKESWDVEHINSNTTNSEDDEDTQKEWLLNFYSGATATARQLIDSYFTESDKEKRKAIFKDVKALFPTKDEWKQDEKNRLWNYTLLDSSTNRSYGNSIFSGKRRVIIGKDKGEYIPLPRLSKEGRIELSSSYEAGSSFVPPCTMHVFMKYYSPAVGDNNYWSKDDAQAYLSDIRKCIEKLEEKPEYGNQ